jgi:hypothetical protein
MERICGDEWSGSLVHDGDLLPCIQALLVRIPPPLLLMVPAAVWRLWTLRQRPPLVERKLLEPRLAFLCVSLQLLLALLSFVFSLATSPRPYEVFEGLATLGGWSASLSVLSRERRCQLRLHPASRIYWAIDFLTSTKALETAIWSMAHGNELDDSMLLSMLRWPIAAVLLYFSLAWRSRGFDDNAEPEMTSVGAAQGGGLRSLRSPREYVVVDRDEEEAWGGGDTASRPEHPQGLWGRFMQFALPDDESIEKVDMSLKGVNHVDSGSFLRIDSPLPRPLPLGLPPPHAHEALRVPRPRDPSTHPLYEAEVLVPSVTESTVRHRSVVQFCVSVRVRSPTFASGDQSIDTITVWKKAREFEGLHDMVSAGCVENRTTAGSTVRGRELSCVRECTDPAHSSHSLFCFPPMCLYPRSAHSCNSPRANTTRSPCRNSRSTARRTPSAPGTTSSPSWPRWSPRTSPCCGTTFRTGFASPRSWSSWLRIGSSCADGRAR